MPESPDPAAIATTMLLSPRGSVLRVDPGWASLTGLDAEDIAAGDVWRLVAAADHGTLLSAIDAVAAGAEEAELLIGIRQQGGGHRPMAVELVLVDEAAAAPVLALSVLPSAVAQGAPTPGMVHEAWRHGRLTLVAQPIYDSTARDVVRHELLVRMRLRDGREVRAAQFLPAAERLGLTLDIDCWVGGRAVALLAADAGGTSMLEVNIGTATVRHPETFLRSLAVVLDAATIEPRRLTVALPGAGVTVDPEAARRLLTGLTQLGVQTALDHVDGTEDELAVIDLLPFDTIKISGRLASSATDGEDGLARLAQVIDAAHRRHAEAAVSSIDDPDTLRMARDQGADMLQGFELSPPIEAPDG